jgi:amino acid adenylation domain-containing protein
MIYLLHHYLEQSAARYPQKTAIQSGSQTITYQSLWEKSNRLANQLVDIAFTPRYPVGIFLPKSIEAVISMFAILKAGGIYIPLDSYYSPLSRIKRIIQLSEMDYIITHSGLWDDLVSAFSGDEVDIIKGMKVILIDDLLADDIRQNTGREIPGNIKNNQVKLYPYGHSLPGLLLNEQTITDDDLAYILYTSGSTGVPKGVMLSHRNALTFVNWSLSYFKPCETDVFSNIAPLHFDLSVFDIFVSLACGGSLQLLPPSINSNPRAIVSWIRDSRITYFYSVPSLWVSILNYADLKQDDLPTISHILFAGEIFPPRQLKILMGLITHADYYNLYGPTETNVCTCYHVKDKDEITDIPVPIGSVCSNTEVIVIKDDDTEASLNEEGELLVKGSIVSKGYYKNPRRTKAAFRESPLRYHHSELFYRTGDIVRVIAPGSYQYLCRKDLMVKCSGFRVELQEVEQALMKHQVVQEVIVVPVYDDEGVNALSLAAFITTKDGKQTGVIELKKFLAEILPRYMIPETITVLEELPKNANGKADRQQLAEQVNKEPGTMLCM